MSDTNKLQLIKRLKLQPRLGADPFADLVSSLRLVFNTYKDQGAEVIRQNVFGFLASQVQTLNDNLNVLEDLNTGVQAGFNKNVVGAAKLGVTLDGVAKNAGVNATKFKGYAADLRNVYVGQTKFYKDNPKFATQIAKQSDQIQNQLGITGDAYESYVRMQEGAIGRLNDATQKESAFKKLNDEIGSVALGVSGFYDGALTDIIGGMGELGQASLATFGRMPKELALAVLKSKALGVNLEKITGAGEGFLDIEKAIADEMEFQILSGQELTTLDNKSFVAEYQKAAIQQDANKQAELFAGFVEKYGEDLKTNLYLQTQTADMFGLTKDELFTAVNQFNALGAEGSKVFKQQAGDIKTVTDAFTKATDKEDRRTNSIILQDESTKDYINSLGDYVDKVDKLQKNTADVNQTLMGTAETVGNAAANSPLINAAYATGQTYTQGQTALQTVQGNVTGPKGDQSGLDVKGDAIKQDDIFIPAGGSNVISGPLGSFELNSKDDIIAMPNARAALANNGGGDVSAIIAALNGMSFHVTNIFDGDKIQSSLQIRQGQRLNNTGI
jgi:hypothetical protein